MLLDKAAEFLDNCLQPVTRWINVIGVSIGFAMILVVVFNVTSRYLFGRPLGFTVELIEIMLLALVFFGLGYAQLQKNHITVDILTLRLSQNTQAVIDFITYLLSLGVFAIITWRSAVLASGYWADGVLTDQLQIPSALLLFMVSFGSMLLFLAFLTDLFKSMAQVIRNGQCLWLMIGGVLVLALFLSPMWIDWLQWSPSVEMTGFIGIGILIVLLFSGATIGSILALVGFLGMSWARSVGAGIGLMGMTPYASTANYIMAIIPFFILMGEFCFQSGLSTDLYSSAYKWLGSRRGGLASATVVACGIFAAVTASSLATVAALSRVALPEMKKYNYHDTLATGSIVAGGSIGVLIPPSTILVFYGILTEQPIAMLLLAGILPGVLSVIYYVITVSIICRINPDLGPQGPKFNFKDKVVSLWGIWPALVLFVLVIGGMVGGVFTPTEAGAMGAFGAFLYALGKRQLNWKSLFHSLLETGRMTAMVFLIYIGTQIFGYFLAVSRFPMMVAEFAAGLPLHPSVILVIILAVYFFLGCFMGVLPLVMITVPIFFPVITALGFHPVWFGIMIVMIVEVALITPPVGMNLYIVKGVAKDIPLSTLFRGILPFLVADGARIATIIAFPQIALFLPDLM